MSGGQDGAGTLSHRSVLATVRAIDGVQALEEDGTLSHRLHRSTGLPARESPLWGDAWG